MELQLIRSQVRFAMATALLHRTSAASSTSLLCPQLARLFSSSDDTVLSIEPRIPFTGHKIEPPLRMVDTTPNELLSFFPHMEITADSLYKAKLICSFCHLYWPGDLRRRNGGHHHQG